jgi:hypothetical protein
MDECNKPDISLKTEDPVLMEFLRAAYKELAKLRTDGSEGIDEDFIGRYLEGLRVFNSNFIKGCSDPDHFISLSNIESLVMQLLSHQKSLAKELAWNKMKEINESALIEKKKGELLEKGVRIKKWRVFPRTMMTLFGPVRYERTALIGSTPNDEKRLFGLTGEKMLFPLDMALGTDKLPFKLSVGAMLEIGHWVQEVPSYQAATRAIWRNTNIETKEDTVRIVANHIGSMVFEAEKAKAEEVWTKLKQGRIRFPDWADKKNSVLYIEVDGAMIHTRKPKNEDKSVLQAEALPQPELDPDSKEKKSVWMENKLGMIFNSNDFFYWTDKHGERHHEIGAREYVAYLGSAEEFKKFLFAAAIRNNYGYFKHTVLISDGAQWIKNMKDEIFYDADHILDLYHLCENVNKFAKDVFNLDKNIYKPWSDNICKLLKESKYKEVLKIISQLSKRRLSRSEFSLYNYIENNKDNIDYVRYKNNGWYVGSGAIESANKTVLQFRLKQAGMRWRQDCGQYIVSLMARAKSGLWDRDVVGPVRNKYEVAGADLQLEHRIAPMTKPFSEAVNVSAKKRWP